MAGDTLTLEDCQEQNICYDCLYDLTITITDDCGGTPIILTRSNFSLFNIDTLCNAVVPIEVDTTLTLTEGSYTITKTLTVNENGMAWYRDNLFIPHNTCQDFNEILEEQMAIVSAAFSCDTSSAVRQEYLDYRRDMLLDMYPLIGQYADTTTETDTDENGDPALVLNSQGNMVNPNTLSPEEFIANFQPSWAAALLPLHPEYNLLGHYEGYVDSHDWDQDFLATDTYAEAKAKGYLNPTGNTTLAPATNFGSPTNSDPLSTDYSISTTFKNEIEEILFSFKTIDPGEGEVDITLWGMATAISKCTNATDGDCFLTWNENTNAFNESTLCEGELDMAWRAFRNLYQNAKKNLLIGYIRDQASSYSVVQCPCQPHFGIVEEVLGQAGFSQTQDDTTLVQNGINQFYADNCNAYALRWLQQLGSCNYTPAQADTVIKYLTEVCKRGADEVHPFGASSIHPDSTYTFDNFEEVIAYYNDQFGVTTNVNCNAYLIDKPLPYNQPGIIMNKEQWNRPDSCSCAKITGYYAGYQADSLSYESFAHYLQSYYHIEIAEGALDTLLGLCDSSISCNFLASPVILPAALQCGTGDLCVTCPQYRVAFDQFVEVFPGITPSFEEIDTLQQRNNLVFANFMNNQFGFDKTAQEYLEYMATSCPAADTSAHCDSLLNMLQNYYYTHIRPSSGYVDLDMRTFAGNRTPLPGPKGVFNVNKQLIGRTVSGTVGQIDTSFASIWNSDVANQVVGELSPLGSGRFRLTLNEGQGAPCHGIIGMRYYEFDNAKDSISAILTGVNCYIDFGDGSNVTSDTSKTVGSSTIVSKYELSQRSTWIFGRYQPHYQMNVKHYYVDTLSYTICVYHTDTMGVFGFDNLGVQAGLKVIRNLRGYMPQHTLSFSFHNTQDSTINSVDSIYNFESVFSIELLHFDTGDGGITQFLNNNFDPFTNNDGLKEAWIGYGGGTVPSGYSVRPVNGFLPNLPVNFPDLSFIRIDDLEKHDVNALNFSISGLQGLHLRNSTSITAGRIDSILNQVASAAVKDSGLIYFEAIPEGAVRTSASDAAVATLTAKKWTLWGAGMDINGNLPAAATGNYAFENVFTNEFTEYFNSVRGTNYTFTQIRALYDSCGYLLDLCNIPLADSNLLCGKNQPVNISVEPYDEDPCKDSTDFAWVRAYEKQRILYDSLRNVFEQTYLDTCLNLGNRESFTVTRPVSEYHYTLYYYDQAGNLVKTIPPEGVRPNRDPEWLAEVEEKRLLKETQVPSHFLPTVYRYNSLNQVVSQKSPDGGLSKFWYDRLGRLSVSQNAKQAVSSKYSVTHYDPLGRIILVAEKSHPVAISNTIAQNPRSLYNWIFYGTTSNAGFAYEFKEATVTVYDQVSSTYPYYVGETPFTPKAHTLRNRVSASRYYTSMGCYYNVVGSDTVWITDNVYIDNAIEYSYDIHGNVDSMLNIYNLNTLMFYHDQNRFKMITYKYDLVSGKVNEVHYNPSTNDGTTYISNDEFYHRYIYDADNRLTDVYTTDTKELIGQSPLDEHEAHYQYYKHGPLRGPFSASSRCRGWIMPIPCRVG
ncbi:MAG: hypothetical protein B7Z54_01080 [Sphingobacteriales bacterium 12-47-4]|nr:MAG: hypothetical protein B7Z54_01080 [Sphingobacteriales bacterium 12-47-4]